MIAIPNMEKPKSCKECPIRIAETMGVYYDSKSDEYKRVKITGCDEAKYHTKTLGEGYKMMYKDCPLIEIPQEDEKAVLFLLRMRKATREGKSWREFLDEERRAE